MTKKLTFFIMLIIFPLLGYSQTEYSLLYNNEGQLRADTSLKISKEQLSKWALVEERFIFAATRIIVYPEMAMDCGISGKVTISFDIDSTTQVKNFKTIKRFGIEENIKLFLLSLEFLSSLAPKDNQTFTYFLSFEFKDIDAAELIKKNNTIPIHKSIFYFIPSGIAR